MTSNLPNNNFRIESESQKEDEIEIAKYFFLMLSNWYWFALALSISFFCAWFYINHTLPTWRVSSTVLIEDNKKGNSLINSKDMLSGFGVMPGMQSLDNQLIILTSWTLIEKTLSKLPFYIEYYVQGKVNKVAFYPDSPIRIYSVNETSPVRNIEFEIKLVNDIKYSIISTNSDILNFEKQAQFGDTIDINGWKIRIEKMQGAFNGQKKNKICYFMVHSRDHLVASYKSRLTASPASKEGTIIKLSLEGTNTRMDIDFLAELMQVFLDNNLERKNQEAARTINFIEDQLIGISDSLKITEDKLQKFRSENRVMDISAQGQQIISEALRLENEKAKLVIESNYFDYLSGYLSKDMSGELPVFPATIGITDPGLTKLVSNLADLQGEYFSKSITDKNPLQAQIAQQLRNTRDALNETLNGVKEANDLAIKKYNEQLRFINASAVSLPKTERELLGFQREFKLNDVLYSFLLEKMAEAQIQKASNTPDNEIIDNPRVEGGPVAPKTRTIYLFALLAGAGFPFISIIILEALNNIIKNEEDLRKITDLPIAGYVPHSIIEGPSVVMDSSSSIVAESFRSLRTKIQFFTKEAKSPAILITSSVPSEGKTFTSINLAGICSLLGKKTILLEFDLRRPKIHSQLTIPNETGISTWLIGQNSLKEIIQRTEYDNLDLITAGPIPPNPAELIASKKTSELFEELRNIYDYIIIDSAPIGTVSDSLTLASLADVTLVLVRHGKTIAPVLSNTISGIISNGITGISLVMNDIGHDIRKYRYGYKYGYRYGYRYGYQYGYHYGYTSSKK